MIGYVTQRTDGRRKEGETRSLARFTIAVRRGEEGAFLYCILAPKFDRRPREKALYSALGLFYALWWG